MERKRTLAQYRSIDLALLAVILCVFEGVTVFAARRLIPRSSIAFTVSLAAGITCIVYMRWGAWGAIHAFLSGAAWCVFSGAGSPLKNPEPYTVYCAGNLLSLFTVLYMNGLGRERVRKSAWLTLLAGAFTLLCMQTGRAAVSLCFSRSVWEALSHYTTDALSMVFTLVTVWVARRADGLFEEQKHYLARISRSEGEERP